MSDDRITPLPPVRRRFSSAPIERPGPEADLRAWTNYFADVAIVLERRATQAVNPSWRNVAAILGVVGFGISMGLLAWHICSQIGPCR